MRAIERLAEWTLAIEPAGTSALALRQARLLLLDSIGCAYAAIESGAADPIRELAVELGGPAEATIIGSPDRASVLNAVLANGALVRVLDLNDVMFTERDGHLAIGGHRSDNIPVALAVAEKCGGSGRQVLEAIVLNYELYGRLRELMPEDAPWDGASASGLVAAAMAGRLMGLDRQRLPHALALAAARSATPRIVRYGNISAAKSLANALVAQAGLQAALLAAKGVTGPLEILDDRRAGLHQVFDPARGLDRLWAPIPEIPQIMHAHLKSYPSIGTSQTAVKAALDARARFDGRIDRIERIEVTMADGPAVRRQQADPSRLRPRSREAADHSFGYIVAVALLDGELSHRQFEDERWIADAAVMTLMERVVLRVSPELGKRAPGSMPCRIGIRLVGGEEIVAEVLYPPGHSFADRGLDQGVVEAKFHDVTGRILPAARRHAIATATLGVDDKASFRALMKMLARRD